MPERAQVAHELAVSDRLVTRAEMVEGFEQVGMIGADPLHGGRGLTLFAAGMHQPGEELGVTLGRYCGVAAGNQALAGVGTDGLEQPVAGWFDLDVELDQGLGHQTLRSRGCEVTVDVAVDVALAAC